MANVDLMLLDPTETADQSDKAWGQRKSSFYDTDFIGDEAQLNVSDESLAEEEEREAIALQKRTMDSLEPEDYGMDAETMQLNRRNDAEPLQHQWPELMELSEDLADGMKYIKEKINPLEDILHRIPDYFTEQEATLVRAFKQFHHLYCVNVMLYLNIRASKVHAEDHPVIKRIVELREIINLIRTNVKELTSRNPLEYYQRVKAQKKKKRVSFIDLPLENDEEEGEIPTEESKRGITYQIAQNKGLTPKRKKEQKNPRVKYRNKYIKAVKKHRKVVRPVENELARYGGERGGIKAHLSRSVKIK